MIADGLKLSVYFGDSLTIGQELCSDALMRALARSDVRTAVLLRGVEGFGAHRRIHAERLPDISTDLPLLATAVDTRERIHALLPEVDSVVPRGLVTLEHVRLATGDDVAHLELPRGTGQEATLTVVCGRGHKVRGRLTYRQIVDALRRHGAAGAIVLPGVDGVVAGRRTKARLFAANPDTPAVTASIGRADSLRRALPELRDAGRDAVITLERVAHVKHEGELLHPPPPAAGAEADVWHTLRIYTRRSTKVDGRALHTELMRRLREVGGAGATTVVGEWGFFSGEQPYGDRLGRLASHSPSCTLYIDRPAKVAEVWPLVDDLTARHGMVTWFGVPGYRERTGDAVSGHLRVEAD